MLNIAKNFSGDVMSFEIGAELARAEGIESELVVIADDVAVENSTWTQGRRGLGTALFAEKVCGAAADQGRGLAEIAAICRHVNDVGRSMGMALTSCTVPAKGSPTFDLPDDQMEIGVGVHGEPGRKRMPLKEADEIVEILSDAIITDLPFKKGDEVWALVNGLGGTPLVELYVIYNKLADICAKKGIKISSQPGRQLCHVAGYGRLLHHPGKTGLQPDQALGLPGQYIRFTLGGLTTQ